LGRTIFYMAALCNLFGLELQDIIDKEHGRVSLLGPYNLT
jgi:hypothetical protein